MIEKAPALLTTHRSFNTVKMPGFDLWLQVRQAEDICDETIVQFYFTSLGSILSLMSYGKLKLICKIKITFH